MSATLDDLPTELTDMILVLLGPDEIMQMHSTSRSWRTISDQRYNMFFFDTLLVFMDEQGLDRLEAISQSECRKRIRTVAFSLHEPRRASTGDVYNSDVGLAPLFGTEETAATLAVTKAMNNFENCTCISVGPGCTSLWISPYKGDEFSSIQGFYDRNGRRSRVASWIPTHHRLLVLHTALRAAAASLCIRKFTFEMSDSVWPYGIDPGSDWMLDGCRSLRLNHIQELHTCTSFYPEWPKTGLPALLDLFTSIKILDVSFITDDQKIISNLRAEMSQLLIEGIQSLTLGYIWCDLDSFLSLVQDPRARTIHKLTLSHFDIDGGLQAWIEALEAICHNLELTELHLVNCASNINELIYLCPPDLWTRKPGGNKVTYYDLSKSTRSRVVEEFIKDLSK